MTTNTKSEAEALLKEVSAMIDKLAKKKHYSLEEGCPSEISSLTKYTNKLA